MPRLKAVSKRLPRSSSRLAAQINAHGLMPIIEPEVTISIADKAEAETMLMNAILEQLDALPADQQVMLKLTLPEIDGLYSPLVDHPRVMRVVALVWWI